MVLGYARVSTDKQELSRQIDMLNSYGVERIFSDTMTGSRIDRPQFGVLMQVVRSGDTVVVESLSRLARSTKGLLELIDFFKASDVKLISLKEQIDTESPTGKLLTTVLSAISQFERDIIVQRTKEGLASARIRGRKGGRPPIEKAVLDKAVKLYASGVYSAKDTAKITGISQATLFRAVKAARQSGGNK